jgi:RNA polymerase sigma-70 factor (ECF subfamily)
LRRCRAGDAEALEELIRRWEGKLFYYVRRLVADEADAWDILQQTWARGQGDRQRQGCTQQCLKLKSL